MHPKPKSHKYRLVPNCRKKTLIEIFFYLALTWKTLKIFVFLSKMPKRQDLDKESKT